MISFIVSSHPPDGTFSADKRMRDGTYRTRAKNASLKLDFSKDLRKFLDKKFISTCRSLLGVISQVCTVSTLSVWLWLPTLRGCVSALLIFSVSDRRFTDNTNRVVNAPTVRIQEPPTNGVNPAELSDALSSGKSKKKAYRRWVEKSHWLFPL